MPDAKRVATEESAGATGVNGSARPVIGGAKKPKRVAPTLVSALSKPAAATEAVEAVEAVEAATAMEVVVSVDNESGMF